MSPWIPAIACIGSSVLLGLVIQAVLLPWLRRWSKRVENLVNDLLIESVARQLAVWALLAGLAGAAQTAPIEGRHQLLVHKTVVALFLLSLTFALARLASLAVRQYSRRLRGSEQTTGLLDNLVRGGVIVLGGLLILSNLGIAIAPLLGALGVGSLAVALGLQDTLTNLFAGVHLVASEVVSVGDIIRIDSGQEGTVADVGWRVTRLDDGNGNTVMIPNSKLAAAIVTNFHQPNVDTSVSVSLAAPYGADLAKVERVALEVARELQRRVPGATRDFEPSLRFKAFGDDRIDYTVVLRADRYPERHVLIHEFIKACAERYKAEGLEFAGARRLVLARPSGEPA